jgi:hypothetical protein
MANDRSKSMNEQLATIGAALALVGVLWAVAGAWFALAYRVQRLEDAARFLHGDTQQYMRETTK